MGNIQPKTGHRRSLWIGYGALVAGVLLAVAATAVLGLMLDDPRIGAWGVVVAGVAGSPLLVPARVRHIVAGLATCLTAIGVALSVLSIGWFFLPVLLCLAVATLAWWRS